jgi:hypothetical protein
MDKSSVAIKMTAPVIGDINEDIMSFVLPFEYQRLEQVPEPMDPNIFIKEIPSRNIAVIRFSGWYNSQVGIDYFRTLYTRLQNDSIISHDVKECDLKWSSAQYNPPFTIPMLRRNEIWIELDEKNCPDMISKVGDSR